MSTERIGARSTARDGDAGVAIIGMAGLFPGAPNIDAYWANILGKVDAISDPPPEAWDPAVYYAPGAAESDRIYCKRGGYLGSLVSFDPLAHGIPPIAVGGEPDQWLALQVARDALADAGCADLDEEVRRRTAVILGKGTYLNGGNAIAVQHGLVVGQTIALLRQLHPEYTEAQLGLLREELKRGLPPMGPETVPGMIPNITVGRIANRLDLMGPTYTVDAACASSLVAIQLALRDLRTGECDLALVGGAQVWVPVATLNMFCQLEALSRQQQIRPFDKGADGTLLSEGIGMVVLKRLADAERDGDRIYAVIRGVGVASDGKGTSVMAPRVDGEVLALDRAYRAANVDPATVGLIEAHGTGTPVGDVVELQALRRVFGGRDGRLARCALGSVKSMIGHTMPAAGVAGLIKTALALFHQVLPPTLHCPEPNPKLELATSPFYLNTEVRPWVHGASTPRRAGISAFGFGGINAHLVVEEHRASGPAPGRRRPSGSPAVDVAPPAAPERPLHAPPWDSEVCILGGGSAADLTRQARELVDLLDAVGDGSDVPRLLDVACAVNRRFRAAASPLRLAVVATGLDDLRAKLAQAAERLADPRCRQIKDVSGIYFAAEPLGRQGRLAFLFPGEGSQYPNMLADLCLHVPEVRDCFDRVDRLVASHPRGDVPSDFVFPRSGLSETDRAWAEQRLMQMDGAVEAVLTANQAIFRLLSRLGLRPDAVLGHSTGDYSALAAAGVLVLDDEERTESYGRILVEAHRHSDGDVGQAVLLAVGTDRQQAEAIAREAGGELYVAMDNCAHQVVLVGEAAAAERARAIAQRDGLIYERLTFDRAYHTPSFAPYASRLDSVLARVPIGPPTVPVYSCTSVAPYSSDPAAIRALMVDHWVKTVEFRATVERLYADGVRLFVEVGARGNLCAFVEDILRGRPFCAVPANVQRRSGVAQLNHLVGILAAQGLAPTLEALYERRNPRPVGWWPGDAPAAPPRRPIGPRVALSTRWPMLRLDDAAVERVRAAGAWAANGPSAPPAERPTPAAGAAAAPAGSDAEPRRTGVDPRPLRADDAGQAADATAGAVVGSDAGPEPVGPAPLSAPLLSPPALAEPPAPLPIPSGTPVGPASAGSTDAGTAAMQAYFASMEQFLAVEAQVIDAYLRGLGGAAASSPGATTEAGATARPSRDGDAPPGPGADGSPAAPLPLLGEVVSCVPGAELVAERTVDLAEDLYLLDHTLGRDVSPTRPELRALAVMPLTMSLEIAAEAAACLLPGLRVVGLRDVRVSRWLTWEDRPRRLRVTARRAVGPGAGETATVAVALRDVTDEAATPEADRAPAVEATVVLAEAYPAAPPARLPAPPDARPSRWAPERLYRDAMFHGPRWQGVAAIQQTGAAGAVATLRTLPFAGWLRSRPEPGFVLDPLTLDAAGQVVGFWTTEHLATGKVVFPFRVAAVELYGPPRPAGERVTCTAAIALADGQTTRADLEITTADGRLWMRLVGWEDRRLDLPDTLFRLVLTPQRSQLSAAWSVPTARLVRAIAAPVQVRQARPLPVGDRGFWGRVWAGCMLGPAERALFAALRFPEARRLDWLAARAAAKEGLRDLLLAHAGLDVAPADIEIITGEHGQPCVVGPWLEPDLGRPVVSLAHADGWGATLVGLDRPDQPLGALRLGVDVERLRPRAREMLATGFSPAERRCLDTVAALPGPPADAEEWALRAWCAKEAAAKATGYGLVEGPGSVLVVAVDAARETVGVRLAGRLEAACPDLAGRVLEVETVRDGDLVVAVTACRPFGGADPRPAPALIGAAVAHDATTPDLPTNSDTDGSRRRERHDAAG